MSGLTVKKVHIGNHEAKQVYFEAFPKNERMPYPLMIAMSKLWNTDFLIFYDGATPVGILYLAKNFRLVFIMFFAVAKEFRGRGYGSKILRYISEKYRRKIIISIEPCDCDANDLDIRQKRKAFYQKNGYSDTEYRMKLNGVEQEIIIAGGEFKKGEFVSFFAHYSR